MNLVRFEKMDVELGDILEPTATLYSAKEPKSWNGHIKVHLKTPTIDRHNLLNGTRMFALTLDNGLQIAKSPKATSTRPSMNNLLSQLQVKP